MALTDTTVKQAKAKTKPYSLKDLDGLFLFVAVNGRKSWHFRFQFAGKAARISFGVYPEISLKDARQLTSEARSCIAKGQDPRKQKKEEDVDQAATKDEQDNGVTFLQFSTTWLKFKFRKLNAIPSKEKKNKGRGSTEIQITRALDNDLLPALANKAMKSITRTDLLKIQQRIENRGALSVAEKVRGWLREMFSYAVATGELDTNVASNLDVAALPYRRNTRYPSITVEDMPELLAKITEGTLVLPFQDIDGNTIGAQLIDTLGNKIFFPHSQQKTSFIAVQTPPSLPLCYDVIIDSRACLNARSMCR